MLSPITIALVLLVGVSLGLLGSGGSILLIPILVYIEGVSPFDAVLISLAVVGLGSVFGAWLHARRGRLDVRVAVLFAMSGAVGAVIGSRWTTMVSDTVLMLTFGVLMLGVGVGMRRAGRLRSGPRRRIWRSLIVGFAVGLLTGFLGVGGGFLLVPAMVLVEGLDAKRAVASSLAVIAVNALSGLAGHLWIGARLPVESVSSLAAVMLGTVGGTVLGGRLEARVIEKVFAVLVLVIGTMVVAASLYRLVYAG